MGELRNVEGRPLAETPRRVVLIIALRSGGMKPSAVAPQTPHAVAGQLTDHEADALALWTGHDGSRMDLSGSGGK